MSDQNGWMTAFDSWQEGAKISRHFARFMHRLAGENCPELFLAAGLLSRYTEEGHVCLDLTQVAGKPLTEVLDGTECRKSCPQLAHWIKVLRESRVVGSPGEYKPMILDDAGRLYLYRYWEYEQIVADNLTQRASRPCPGVDHALLEDGLKRLFPEPSGGSEANAGEPNWQKIAAMTAVCRMFCVISGGPGAGKTSTVVKVLALLIEQAKGKPLRIALAAPTGKAAKRLQESIRETKGKLASPAEIIRLIPDEASTIHRLLGIGHSFSRPHYHEGNPLPYEVVVVDEASMIDLPLMAKLVQAVAPSARLIILGDKDQLASVEAGGVLSDICGLGLRWPSNVVASDGETDAGQGEIPLRQEGLSFLVILGKSYRFGSDSGIGVLSRSVKEGEGKRALSLLKGLTANKYQDIAWRPCPPAAALPKAIAERVIQEYADYFTAKDPNDAFQLFNRFRLLCAMRQGPYGAERLNALIEDELRRAGLIKSRSRRHYPGQPIMISCNDYQLGLFNGDLGLILPDPTAPDTALSAYFPTSDGAMRKIPLSLLPGHETVYAMTVHKSQGSEFDRILLLLPDTDAKILTRELIYTSITRAKNYVEVWSQEEIFLSAVSRRIERQSGLQDALLKFGRNPFEKGFLPNHPSKTLIN